MRARDRRRAHGGTSSRCALDHAADHLSLYQLTIEEGTPFAARHAAGTLRTPNGAEARAQYLLTQELCEAAGLPAYEVSNHARPGSESRHNLLYWRGHDYAGIGPGAHSRITTDGTKRALSAIKSPEGWLAEVEASGHGFASDESLERRGGRRRISADGLEAQRGHRSGAACRHRRPRSRRGRASRAGARRPHRPQRRRGLPPRPKGGSCSTG